MEYLEIPEPSGGIPAGQHTDLTYEYYECMLCLYIEIHRERWPEMMPHEREEFKAVYDAHLTSLVR